MSSLQTKLPQAGVVFKPKSRTDGTPSVCSKDSGGNKNLIKPNLHFNIATYNAQTLLSDDKLIEMEEELKNINWDIVGVSEVRRATEKLITLKSGNLFYHSHTDNSIGGVGFFINKRQIPRVTAVKSISSRVAYINLNLNSRYSLKIIQVYAPTSDHDDEEVDMFYEDISTAANDNRCYYTITCGDFNAKVGKNNDTNEIVTGNYGSGDRNNRGKQLINFLLKNSQYLMNTYFKKKECRRWTWISPNGLVKNEIDYFISNKKSIFQDVTVLNKFSTGSDHRMLRSKIRFNLQKERYKLTKQKKKYKWFPPEDPEQFTNTINKSISISLSCQLDTEAMNDKIIKAIKLAEKKNCTKPTNKHEKIGPNCRKLMEQRRKMKSNPNATLDEVRSLNIRINKEIRKDVRKFKHEIICKTIEDNCNMKVLRSRLSSGKNEIIKLMNCSGDITNNRSEILEIARKFYENLYKSHSPNTNLIDICSDDKKVLNQGSEEIPDITPDEVKNALFKMKNNKAPGEDEITVDAIKLGGDQLIKTLASLFNLCLTNGTIPKQWNNAVTILLHKKGNITDLQNYRPISLLSHLYKIFMKIICNRLTSKLDFYQPTEQAGFRSGYGTNDHLQTIKTLIEKSIEYNRPLVLTFVDFQKAFDTVELWAILAALQQSRIDFRYAQLLHHIYTNATSVIRLHENSKPFKIERGVRQGDTISPKLFTCVLEYIFKTLSWEEKGISINGTKLHHLRFADDIVLISDCLHETREMIRELSEAADRVGLKMNFTKTKFMTNLVASENFIIDNNLVDQVHSYKYLGHEITIGRDNQTQEITKRISLGWAAFGKLQHIMKGKISLNLKREAFVKCIMPVLTYGAETLTLTKVSASKLQKTQRAMERAMLGVSLRDKIPNVEIRSKTKLPDILTQVAAMKWKWAGHLARTSDDRWTKTILQWRPWQDKRSRGRPPTRWSDDIKRVATNWMSEAQDRTNWIRLGEAYIQQWMNVAG